MARNGTLTLVYSARDTDHNSAVVLAEVLRRGLPGLGSGVTVPLLHAWKRLGCMPCAIFVFGHPLQLSDIDED
ncbi:MAG: hypothetical protein M3256_17400 [Actinomycetota bacterium]|nr:hypothetical protein [Actinomycetota bacterium]